MGHGAYIRCNCYEKGLTKPFKYPQYIVAYPDYLDLNFPAELIGTPKEDEIRKEFSNWKDNCCEHDDGEYFHARIANNAGMGHFRSTIYSLNGEKNFPTLDKYLPVYNDGYLPFEENEKFKKELLKLKSYGKFHSMQLYYEDEDGYLNICGSTINGIVETFLANSKLHMGLDGDNFWISIKDKIVFKSYNFIVTKNEYGYIYKDKKSQKEFNCEAFFLDHLFEKMNKIVFSTIEEDIDIEEEHGYKIDTLLTLIEKSNEIGMSVCWC